LRDLKQTNSKRTGKRSSTIHPVLVAVRAVRACTRTRFSMSAEANSERRRPPEATQGGRRRDRACHAACHCRSPAAAAVDPWSTLAACGSGCHAARRPGASAPGFRTTAKRGLLLFSTPREAEGLRNGMTPSTEANSIADRYQDQDCGAEGAPSSWRGDVQRRRGPQGGQAQGRQSCDREESPHESCRSGKEIAGILGGPGRADRQ
jgi:hypothetical protein